MDAFEMWREYTSQNSIAEDYEAWSFGDAPDILAQLVLEGTKTATSSAYPLYGFAGEELPKVNEYSVILNSNGSAVCIIKTTYVSVVPFRQVSSNHAWMEGEGDRSLAYWREIHESFFTKALEQVNLRFDWDMPVVCEEFVRVYP